MSYFTENCAFCRKPGAYVAPPSHLKSEARYHPACWAKVAAGEAPPEPEAKTEPKKEESPTPEPVPSFETPTLEAAELVSDALLVTKTTVRPLSVDEIDSLIAKDQAKIGASEPMNGTKPGKAT